MFGKYFEKLDPDVQLKMGETLFAEGEGGDKAYIISSGSIDLSVKGQELTQNRR